MRPKYGDIFKFDRVLNVFFYTSNADKLVQARLVFMRNGYMLRHFRSQHEPYDEDYSLGTQGLLSNALKQVSERLDVRSMFFVEDTSLRIDALSEREDYPGTRVKEWFAETSFEQLDRQIGLRGGNRAATVKSDIALRIPTLSQPIYFHGETRGEVAKTQPNFPSSLQYPWLTSATFNGWFVPDGSSKRLGEMEFEESLSFDFRVKALGNLMERLEQLNAALNFGTPNHVTRRIPATFVDQSQLPLFPVDQIQVLLVIGNKCAGKSTFSDYLASRSERIFSLEGSTLLRNVALEDGAKVRTSEEVLSYLGLKGWDAVAKRAATYIAREGAALNIVTGLRTVEELLELCKVYPQARIVLIEADQQTRFERHIRRAREGDARSFKDFQKMDDEQAQFGAMRVAHEIADVVIRNDDDISNFWRRIDDLIDRHVAKREGRSLESELHRSVRALGKLGRAATCDEIAEVTAEQGFGVRKYNTNRSLKEIPEFAARVEKRGQLLKYRLLRRGASLLELLNLIAKRNENSSN